METGAKILIVDDIQENRTFLGEWVRRLGHRPILKADGVSALICASDDAPDLILLDVSMPHMNGDEVLQRLKRQEATHDIPVIMITAIDDSVFAAACIQRGADDYLIKPANVGLLEARINACLDRKREHDQEREWTSMLEGEVRRQVKLKTSAHRGTLFAMAKLAEYRDRETGLHLERMREYCRLLAGHLREAAPSGTALDRQFIDDLYAAAPLHDIGKVGIPDCILQKPGRLTEAEFEVMRTHASIGAEALREVDHEHPGNSFLAMGIAVAESHHERWDGSGYPHGLAGEAIPLAARILALGDVYDALTSRRCYKGALPHPRARDIIFEESGAHFDPSIVLAFRAMEPKFLEVSMRWAEASQASATDSSRTQQRSPSHFCRDLASAASSTSPLSLQVF